MDEYINRERARFEAKRYFKNMDEIQEDLDMLFCMLPAENVAPVQHGRWIEQEKYTFGVMYDCSVCGNRILDNGHSWNYCPNCGADMRGSNDEGVTVQEWISVYDELPEVGGYVVCMAKRNPFSRFMPMVARIEKNGWVNPMTEQYISEVTHWMPMPQPLKGE